MISSVHLACYVFRGLIPLKSYFGPLNCSTDPLKSDLLFKAREEVMELGGRETW